MKEVDQMKAQKFIAILLALLLLTALLPAAYAQESETPPAVETEAPATDTPTAEPTAEPTAVPTETPAVEPTAEPTAAPTTAPTAAPTAAPTVTPSVPIITKQPTGETLKAGDSAIFVARADNYSWCAWRFYDKNGTEIVFDKIWGYFPNLKVSGGNSEVFTISNVPKDMNGWTVACLFCSEDGEWEFTNAAKITVTAAAATASPKPSTTPKPSASPSAKPSPSANVSPSVSPSATPLPSPTASAAPVKEASAGALITAAVVSLMAIIAAVIAAIVITSKRNKKKSGHSKH